MRRRMILGGTMLVLGLVAAACSTEDDVYTPPFAVAVFADHTGPVALEERALPGARALSDYFGIDQGESFGVGFLVDEAGFAYDTVELVFRGDIWCGEDRVEVERLTDIPAPDDGPLAVLDGVAFPDVFYEAPCEEDRWGEMEIGITVRGSGEFFAAFAHAQWGPPVPTEHRLLRSTRGPQEDYAVGPDGFGRLLPLEFTTDDRLECNGNGRDVLVDVERGLFDLSPARTIALAEPIGEASWAVTPDCEVLLVRRPSGIVGLTIGSSLSTTTLVNGAIFVEPGEISGVWTDPSGSLILIANETIGGDDGVVAAAHLISVTPTRSTVVVDAVEGATVVATARGTALEVDVGGGAVATIDYPERR